MSTPRELEKALIESGVPASHWNMAELPGIERMSSLEICQILRYSTVQNSTASLPFLSLGKASQLFSDNFLSQSIAGMVVIILSEKFSMIALSTYVEI